MFVLNETNVFRVCCTPVDMRQGILRLSQLVRSNDFRPSDGVVYVFYNRSRNRIKLLHWERCGFVIYHKQMAQGCLSPKIIRARAGFYELRWDELVLYIEGINLVATEEKDTINLSVFLPVSDIIRTFTLYKELIMRWIRLVAQ